MEVYFLATYGEISARIVTYSFERARQIKLKLAMRGVLCDETYNCTIHFGRTFQEVNDAVRIIDLIL